MPGPAALSAALIAALLACTPTRAGSPASSIDALPLNPLTLRGLRDLTRQAAPTLETEQRMPDVRGMPRRVVAFSVDGLRQFALVMEPAGVAPAEGWPVVVIHHGHHPDPPRYGRVADGSTDRPGDYYRDVPTAFASAGFLTVTPDYRGHNDSAGREFTGGMLESCWYARDAIALFRALPALPGGDMRRVFAWGHSMGADVALRAVLALGGEYVAASLWSPAIGDPWRRATHYGMRGPTTAGPSELDPAVFAGLRRELAALPFAYDAAAGDPTRLVGELEVALLVQHSSAEVEATPFSWSVDLVAELARLGKAFRFYSYPGANHFFSGEDFAQAIARDIAFFHESARRRTPPTD